MRWNCKIVVSLKPLQFLAHHLCGGFWSPWGKQYQGCFSFGSVWGAGLLWGSPTHNSSSSGWLRSRVWKKPKIRFLPCDRWDELNWRITGPLRRSCSILRRSCSRLRRSCSSLRRSCSSLRMSCTYLMLRRSCSRLAASPNTSLPEMLNHTCGREKN